MTSAESYSDDELVKLLRSMAEFGCYTEPAGDLMREVADRLEARGRDARWGQRVVGVLGHEAVVRGWDRNGSYLFLEFPESSVPVASPARDWSPA